MLIKWKKASDVNPSDITPKDVFLNRRKFIQAAAIASGASLVPTFINSSLAATTPGYGGKKYPDVKKTAFGEAEKLTTFEGLTTHNNFYEFGTGKSDPFRNARTLEPSPWSVEIAGHAAKTGKFSYEDII
ncbi:MAG: hypothetical protein HOF23_12630, partial [Rhodospirillaceae bacterium]|nr:hypothetical protein [Rhodospirillaceae bacterium]